jgi:site-specific recombinase XerD
METTTQEQRILSKFAQETHLLNWIEAFLIDRKVRGLAKRTIEFYKRKLLNFYSYCDSLAISYIDQIEPNNLRQFLLHLGENGHNQGGIHAHYRTVKTFLRWWEREIEPDGWKNPINKVSAPKVISEPLEPVDLDTIKALLSTYKLNTFYDKRDSAIILALTDTGARASELVSMNLNDLDINGAVLIRHGKGGKSRTVFFGRKTRQAIRKYLRKRTEDNSALWVTNLGERLSYWGLRQIIRRRAKRAGVETPGLHDFRRYFAIVCLRNGMSIYELQRLMGHADLTILRRYLAITEGDTEQAHRKASPVDNSGF